MSAHPDRSRHLTEVKFRDFPGGPGAETLGSRCWGPRLDPWIPHATAETRHSQTSKYMGEEKEVKFGVSLGDSRNHQKGVQKDAKLDSKIYSTKGDGV